MENEVTVIEQDPRGLIALALEKNANPDTLSKLMDLSERWGALQAKKLYTIAMTSFKKEAPAVLIKGDKVDFTSSRGRTHYNYANLGSIVQEITAILGKHELSASWETRQDEKNQITVTCNITHVAGHRESVTLRGPADESGNKNQIQAVGSTVTYLQRYTLLAALGLATGEDDDGRGGKENGHPPTRTVNETETIWQHPNPKIQTAIDFCLKAGKKPSEILTICKKKSLADLTESDLDILRVWLTKKQAGKQSTASQGKSKAPETDNPSATPVKEGDRSSQGHSVSQTPLEDAFPGDPITPGRIACPKGGEADPGFCENECEDNFDCEAWKK